MNKYYKELLGMMNKNENEVKKLLILNYTNALTDIKKELKDYMSRYSDLSYVQMLQYNRLKSLEVQINGILDKLYNTNSKDISNHALRSYEENYFGLFYELESKYKIHLSFSMISEDYVRKAIEYPVGGLKLSERLYGKHLNDLKIKVKACLTDHMINDRGYKVMAKKLSEISNADYKQSLRIAITEGNRLRSLARQDSYEEATDLGIDLKKRWLSTLDHKTRDTHRALDGITIGIDEEFEMRGYKALQPRLFGVASEDINCRCDTITIVEGIAPSLRRDNTTGKVIEYQNYNEWYDKKFGNDIYKGGYWYTKDGTIKITEDYKGEHFSIPRKHKPYSVIETDSVKKGIRQIDRTFYDKNGMMSKQIHSGPHGNLKLHPYGKNGEHCHKYSWDKDGKCKRTTKELSVKDRKLNKDIL